MIWPRNIFLLMFRYTLFRYTLFRYTRTVFARAMPSTVTNAHLHDKSIYYKDGIFCEPPKQLTTKPEEAKSVYHWEERDLLPFAKETWRKSLLGFVVWQKGSESLEIVEASVDGDCASSRRKGKRILTYALVVTAKFHGQRGDAQMHATLTAEIAHDESGFAVDVQTDRRDLPDGADPDRAFKSYELFTNLIRRKGKTKFSSAISDLQRDLLLRGGEPSSSSDPPPCGGEEDVPQS